MKRLLALFIVFWPLQAEAAIKLKRGIALDIWVTWPNEEAWSAPGFLDVFPEWRKTLGARKFAAIKQAGFDFVRLPIDPAPFLWKPDEMRTRHLMAQTLEAVALIRAAGLKVIVDLHSIPAGGERKIGTEEFLSDPKLFAAHRRLVDAFADALKDQDPEAIAFEPFNEPTNDCDEGPKKWPAMLKSLHEAARAKAPALSLVYQGGCWGSAQGLAALDPAVFDDSNIVWSFHSYDPFIVSHQGAGWTEGDVAFVSGLRYPPEGMAAEERSKVFDDAKKRIEASGLPKKRKRQLIADLEDNLAAYFKPGAAEAAMEAPFKRAAAWAAKHKIPADRILLGEFGAIRADLGAPLPVEDRALVISGIRRAAEAQGFSWSVWAHTGSFDMTVPGDEYRFEPALIEALGLARP